MSMMSILLRHNEIQHVYGMKKRNKMIAAGWKIKAFISGRDMSVTYAGD